MKYPGCDCVIRIFNYSYRCKLQIYTDGRNGQTVTSVYSISAAMLGFMVPEQSTSPHCLELTASAKAFASTDDSVFTRIIIIGG